jgi:hypothetical protein
MDRMVPLATVRSLVDGRISEYLRYGRGTRRGAAGQVARLGRIGGACHNRNSSSGGGGGGVGSPGGSGLIDSASGPAGRSVTSDHWSPLP